MRNGASSALVEEAEGMEVDRAPPPLMDEYLHGTVTRVGGGTLFHCTPHVLKRAVELDFLPQRRIGLKVYLSVTKMRARGISGNVMHVITSTHRRTECVNGYGWKLREGNLSKPLWISVAPSDLTLTTRGIQQQPHWTAAGVSLSVETGQGPVALKTRVRESMFALWANWSSSRAFPSFVCNMGTQVVAISYLPRLLCLRCATCIPIYGLSCRTFITPR